MWRQLLYFSSHLLFILLFLPLWVAGESSTTTTTTLSQTGSLSDGQTLISLNKTFELGFFSPNGSSYRYVGIWYHKVPGQTTVWIANRNNPLVDKSGVLFFNNNGELVIIDARGSSFTVAYGLGGKDVEATILDSGNLVLREISNLSSTIWQSFDYPTDTWLPGMKLGVIEGQNRLFTSWRSSSDPAAGDYSFGLDPNKTSNLFIWKKDQAYLTFGKWNGESFTLIPEFPYLGINLTFVSNDEEMYYMYSIIAGYGRYVIGITGQIQELFLVDSPGEWFFIWGLPRAKCDTYNVCGPFGLCNESALHSCTCMQGFAPASQSDWNNGDTSGGCIRQSNLQCSTSPVNITFLAIPLEAYDLPPNYNHKAVNAEQCEAICLGECNCTGYAFSKVCYLLYGDIINLRAWTSGSNIKESVLYVRENASTLVSSVKHSQGDKIKTYIIVPVSSITFLLLCIGLFLIMKWRRLGDYEGNMKYRNNNQIELERGIDGEITLWKSDDKDVRVSLYDFMYIAEATSNFSEENKLGEGGFGPVYKGCFREGQEIAVKRLASTSGQGMVEFKNEILLIARLQHRNLVRLLGCCIREEDKMLIYEYMPNKSLDFFIFDQIKGALLDWGKRFHIVEGIAQGLLYLHKHSRLRIIHRDLKASNILLDEEMNPKIADFGMARMFCSNETEGSTRRIVGTYGYMAPEYAYEGIFSVKSDVFSFGVLLLEIVSGLRSSGFHRCGNSLSLLGYAWDLWKEERWFQLVDQSFVNNCPMTEVRKCIHVALMCVQDNATNRPTMSEVVTMLGSDSKNLPEPKQPAFFTVRVAIGDDIGHDLNKSYSVNIVTNSMPDGR
ncbi:G-type lectin S-receptor-like serine/threonine-protein kinase At4g27290 isoform X1 [Carex rostrata]